MSKKLNEWLDEFVENGADPKNVTDWPENAGGSEGVNYLVECHLDNPYGQATMDVKITNFDSGELILQKTFTNYFKEWVPYIDELVKKCKTAVWFDNLSEDKVSNVMNYIIVSEAYYDTESNKWIIDKTYRNVLDTSETVYPAKGYYFDANNGNELTNYQNGFMFIKDSSIIDRYNFTFLLLS